MKKQTVSFIYAVNIASQALFTLLWQIALGLFLAWQFVEQLGAPDWTYVPLILLGVFTGLVSMVRFILSAMSALDRLEKERDEREKREKSEKRHGEAEK